MKSSLLAITEEHHQLADAAIGHLRRVSAKTAARATLEGAAAHPADIWLGSADLGWHGLAIADSHGGSGFGLAEWAIVLEAMGRELCPGPFLPTVTVAALLSDSGSETLRTAYLPDFAHGRAVGALTCSGVVGVGADGRWSGECHGALGAPDADVLAVVAGEDVIVLDRSTAGLEISMLAGLDTTRSIGSLRLNRVKVDGDRVIRHGARRLRTALRILAAAELLGSSRACLETACEYAKVREQFGRPIGTFQAVKHHLANMFVDIELTTAATWDAARAEDLDSAWFAGAVAACHAARTAVATAQMSIQLHGGIGFTWEHDAHLHLRRARTSAALLSGHEDPVLDVVAAQRSGQARGPSFTLPEDAGVFRAAARSAATTVHGLCESGRRDFLVESGYLVPHWPKPWGRAAQPVEQLVIEEEFGDVVLPDLGISGWVMQTIVEAGSDDQRSRWVEPVLRGRASWCQLFSEPNAGSDAAAVRTAARRVEGGWRVTGQKVWTSRAQQCQWGLATVRTDRSAPKHAGVTMMAIDLSAHGVQVRALRELTGAAMFNEVFLDDVFVPDADVVGDVGQGWRVARATLGNERISIGGGSGAIDLGPDDLVKLLDGASVASRAGWLSRVGEVIAEWHTLRPLNTRIAAGMLIGAEAGSAANVIKLVKAECSQRMTELAMELAGIDAVTSRSPKLTQDYLFARCLTIAGGTSEIMRNTIAERLLGLPRDPLQS